VGDEWGHSTVKYNRSLGRFGMIHRQGFAVNSRRRFYSKMATPLEDADLLIVAIKNTRQSLWKRNIRILNDIHFKDLD
jgi:hypothetical protein